MTTDLDLETLISLAEIIINKLDKSDIRFCANKDIPILDKTQHKKQLKRAVETKDKDMLVLFITTLT